MADPTATPPVPAAAPPPAVPAPRVRSGPGTVRLRISEVLRLVLMEATDRDIFDYSREQGWGVSLSQVRRYKTVALKQIAKLAKRKSKGFFEKHVTQLRFVVAKSFQMNDLRTVHAVLRDLAELHAAYPPKPGTFAAEQVLATLNAVDKLVGDLLTDDAAFAQYRDAMRGIVQTLQATMGKG